LRMRGGGRRLGRKTSHRLAMLRTMANQLVEHQRIRTTLAKAKELKPIAEKMVSLGKRGTIEARKKAASFLRTDDALHRVFTEMAERYKLREGGYTRLMHLPARQKDGAKMAVIEYVDREGEIWPAKPPRPNQNLPKQLYPLAAQAAMRGKSS